METDVKAILFLHFLDWVMQSLKLGFTWFNPPNPPKCEYTFFSICYYVKMPIAVGILGKMNYFPDLVNLVIASGRSIDWELQQWDPSDHLVIYMRLLKGKFNKTLFGNEHILVFPWDY